MTYSRKNVLLVVRPAEGGIQQHVISLAQGLVDRGWSVGIAANERFLQELPGGLSSEHYEVGIASRFAVSDIASAARVRQAARGYGLIHAHGLRAGWVSSLASLPAPLIVTAHNLVPHGRFARLAVSQIARKAARWSVVSDAIRTGLYAFGVPSERIDLIPNGIDLSAYRAILGCSEARQQLSVENGAQCVGYVGRLSPEKGVDVLLKAAEKLPETIFLIAGDGPSRDVLRAAPPSNVRFLGRIEDPRTVYAASDVIVIPSRSEGQGIVAIEALAAGTPVVASHVGGLAETLTHERTALLVPVDDSDALATAIMRVMTDEALRQNLIRSGSQAAADYDIREMLNRTIAAYERATVNSLTNG